jgi:hypothetical protein
MRPARNKYCKQMDYEQYIRHGCFKVGTHAEYRTVYEQKGAEYGDSHEGNEPLLIKGTATIGGTSVDEHGACVITRIENAYVFSASLEYTQESHKRWYGREGCSYDICVVLVARSFLERLAHRLDRRLRQGPVLAGKPIYRTGIIDLQKHERKLGDIFFYKNVSLEWEKEYRLVYAVSEKDPIDARPMFPYSSKLADCIVRVIPLC